MVKGRWYNRPTVGQLTQAIENKVVLDLVHNTGGEHKTERAVVPAYLAYGRNNLKVYLRGYHLNGQSFSNAPPNTQRLFLLKNMKKIKQGGSYWRIGLPDYTRADSQLGRVIAQR